MRKNQDFETMEVAPKSRKSHTALRIVGRFFLVLFTVVFLLVGALSLAANLIFNGPSTAARDVLTMTLTEPSATKWIPGLFMDKEVVDAIRNKSGDTLKETETNTELVVINQGSLSADSDEWANHPDGIRIESISGKTYNAHVMIIKDPGRVYMATSTEGKFSTSIPGTRINEQIETEQASAGINAGAFNDDGTGGSYVGSIPAGILYSKGVFRSNQERGLLPNQGFAGFTNENILVVAKSMTVEKCNELGIRDACEFGPVLIINGEVNQEEYAKASGWNPRTCIGQRKDGAVVFLCIDGRQASSMGGTFKDCIDIMMEYDCVNACAMDGGSSTVMLYRDTQGLYDGTSNPRFGANEDVVMVNSYSVLQTVPRRMPNFWMVRAQ